jgi:hypothetical protein
MGSCMKHLKPARKALPARGVCLWPGKCVCFTYVLAEDPAVDHVGCEALPAEFLFRWLSAAFPDSNLLADTLGLVLKGSPA